MTQAAWTPDVHFMDFGDPWMLFSSLVVGLIGFLMFNHGRREQNFRMLFTGIGLCVYPYFVGSVLMIWAVFAAAMLGLYAIRVFGPSPVDEYVPRPALSWNRGGDASDEEVFHVSAEDIRDFAAGERVEKLRQYRVSEADDAADDTDDAY